jgi:hypothetical protein
MISTIRFAFAAHPMRVLQLATVALALGGVGCGKVGCFEWTEAEGACPSQDEALTYFNSPQCSGNVESVDSEPDFNGDYCCYDITKRENDYYECAAGAGGGSAPPPPPPAPAPAPAPNR